MATKDCSCTPTEQCLFHAEQMDQRREHGITVREFIKILEKLPQDLPVAGGSGDEYMNAITGPRDVFAFKNVVGIQFVGSLYTCPVGHATKDTVCKTDEE
jgi:hypothetical protein